MFVGAKHDRSEYKIITNNLYAVMLRPLQKPDKPKHRSIEIFANNPVAASTSNSETGRSCGRSGLTQPVNPDRPFTGSAGGAPVARLLSAS
ncbi:MAG: hypothetical protein EAZ94_31440 [Oscillatoriales cyanobacterium]|nr:MAG: hypothetical protein EAZ94_31440 [Oscillatoriales cyanobacterium]